MRTILKYFDLSLFFLVLLIAAIGLIAISSATDADIYGLTREIRYQSIAIVLGLIFMAVSLFIDYKWFGKLYIPIYIISIGLLLLVRIPGLGHEVNEATSWIKLGNTGVLFQTSEMAKIGFIIFFAKFFAKYKEKISSIAYLFITFLLAAPFFYLLKEQPDLGTLIVFFVVFVGMAFVSGISLKLVFSSIVTAVITAPIVYSTLNGYQKRRIDMFLNQEKFSGTADAFQLNMSKITIGTGGLKGSGLFKGAFSKNNYLPIHSSDFIFPVYVEEFGFIGGAVLIGLYFLLCTRLIFIAFSAKDNFGSNIVIGVLFMLAFQVFENISMTMGIMPITGVTLPFVSYGASSMLTNMIAISLVLNVFMRRFKKEQFS